MESLKTKARELHIDVEAVATLSMAKIGLFAPVKGLMNEKEHRETDESKMYDGTPFPFSFILAPSGNKNKEVLETTYEGEVLTLMSNKKRVGFIRVESTFKVDPRSRVEKIYGTCDESHPGVIGTLKRLGDIAISGYYEISFPEVEESYQEVQNAIARDNATRVSGIVLAARPFHRAHERVIRQLLDKSDILVIFLSKPYMEDDVLDYSIRKKTIEFFIKNFLTSHKVIIVPLENTYIFSGISELILNTIVLKNYGCNRFVVGQNHAGLGLYYEHQKASTLFDQFKIDGIDVETVSEMVYCDMCKTLVSVNTCPHGHHHHISYHSDAMLELLNVGIIPPAVLMRTEVSAMILDHKFPKRFKNLSKLFYDLVPNTGVIEEHTQKDMYIALMRLYQTSSLT